MNNFYIQEPSLFQQYQNLTTDFYAQLQKEMEGLTETEIAQLSQFKPYIEANNRLSTLVQGELLNLVRRQINANPEVIKTVIESIKQYKKEKDKELDDIQDYIKNYSDITYKEYKELKYANK